MGSGLGVRAGRQDCCFVETFWRFARLVSVGKRSKGEAKPTVIEQVAGLLD